MSDKILKEAYDKLTAIEEGDYTPMSREELDKAQRMRDIRNKSGSEEKAGLEMPGELHTELDYKPSKELDEDNSRDDVMDGIEELTGIQDELFELIERLDSAIRAYAPRSHAYWQSYGLGQLKIIAGSDEYASHDTSLNNLISDLKDELEGDPNGMEHE